MKLSSILAINAIREMCEEQDSADKQLLLQIADSLRRVVVDEGPDEEIPAEKEEMVYRIAQYLGLQARD